MIERFRHIWQILTLYALLMLSGVLLLFYSSISLPVNTYAAMLSAIAFITLGAYLLIMKGMKKDEKERGIYLLAGLGGKFLAFLVIILLFWTAGKNLTKPFIITFFILYLIFTFFLIRILYKVLK